MKKNNQKPLLALTEQPGDPHAQFVLSTNSVSPLRSLWRKTRNFILAIARALGKVLGMTKPAEINELLSYVPKRDRITEGALLLLEKARGSGQDLTKAQLITAMFLADKGHLDADARPVFFDNYIATEKGPAGVAASEMLDAKYDWTNTVDGKAPWSIEKTPGSLFVRPLRAANTRRLSISDQEAIGSALEMVTSLSEGQLRLFTQRNEAYTTAWNDGKSAGSRLDPRLIPDVRDDELIEDLLYSSRHAYVASYRK